MLAATNRAGPIVVISNASSSVYLKAGSTGEITARIHYLFSMVLGGGIENLFNLLIYVALQRTLQAQRPSQRPSTVSLSAGLAPLEEKILGEFHPFLVVCI